jgi:hypothetical protein
MRDIIVGTEADSVNCIKYEFDGLQDRCFPSTVLTNKIRKLPDINRKIPESSEPTNLNLGKLHGAVLLLWQYKVSGFYDET